MPITLQGIDLPTSLFLVEHKLLEWGGTASHWFPYAHDKLEIPPREGHLISI